MSWRDDTLDGELVPAGGGAGDPPTATREAQRNDPNYQSEDGWHVMLKRISLNFRISVAFLQDTNVASGNCSAY
jgi:hypothetical protein